MSVIVIDSSVAVKWLLEEEYTDSALKVLNPENELHVPDFIFLEFYNVICKRLKRKELSREEADRILDAIRKIKFTIHSFEAQLKPAYKIAISTGASMYDCIYLSIAVSLYSRMVTSDHRFYDRIHESRYSNNVIWVTDLDKDVHL